MGAIGYTRIVKVHFLRTSHVSYVNMRCPTVHCFITTEMAYLPRKIIMIYCSPFSHSYRLINAHLKNVMFPSVTLYKSLPYVHITCIYVQVRSLYSSCRAIAYGDENNNKTTKPKQFRKMLHILGAVSYFVACLLHRSKNCYTRLLITQVYTLWKYGDKSILPHFLKLRKVFKNDKYKALL